MFFLIFFIILINKNAYFINSLFINKINANSEINKSNSIYNQIMGNDNRIIISEKINIEVIKNIHKKEILDKLLNPIYSKNEKLEIIDNYWEFPQTIIKKEINTLQIKMGGLENDWNFEEF